MSEPFQIRKIAVLGAGVMGAQIAAHCVNAGFMTLLYDLPSSDASHNNIANQAIANLKKLKPTPLAVPELADCLIAKNYADDLEALTQCDLVIEAIAERLDWKAALYEKITPYLKEGAIFTSNTSGLSIQALARVLPQKLQPHFCGLHFFNPPRYMHLVELIPSQYTDKNLLDYLESWLTSYLGKGIVRAKDTPNFIANRIGVFSLLSTLHHAQRMKVPFDEVDALTGVLLGRPKSATFRTMDVVGLDTMAHVVRTMNESLPNDPWHAIFTLPEWMEDLVEKGHLGQKSGQGIYRKQGKTIEVLNPDSGDYRPVNAKVSDTVKKIFSLADVSQRLEQLKCAQDTQAQFLAACLQDLMHYCAYHVSDIAETVRDIDLAMRWGFGWQQGPFELWQTAGVALLRDWLGKENKANVPLPPWLNQLDGFYKNGEAFSPVQSQYVPPRPLPVYEKHWDSDLWSGASQKKTQILYENEAIHLWRLKENVAVVSFKSKANTIGPDVLKGMQDVLDIAERTCEGLIIYQNDSTTFSAGADLKVVATFIAEGQFKKIDQMIADFQAVVMRIKYSIIPCVAALRGKALGGGCELLMHCDQVVAGFESYPGLVETGVGLIPAGGGCKELARRSFLASRGQVDLMSFLQPYFEQVAKAFVAGNAVEAKINGYLKPNDFCVMNQNEVLYAAYQAVQALQAANYRPELQRLFQVAGREGHARLEAGLVNWLEGGFISPYDYELVNQLAQVLCGGEIHQGAWVDENWMLQLERERFMGLVQNPLTQARIKHLLERGRPLRN